MQTWTKILLKSLGVGIGIGVGFAISVATYAWYSSRPVPQKPWDSNVVTATFLRADTTGTDNHLMFTYILENHSERDYRTSTSSLLLSLIVQDQATQSLAGGSSVKFGEEDIFLPAKQHLQVSIELPGHHYSGTAHEGNTPDDHKKYREAVRNYVRDNLARLNGFAAFDDANRYRIDFPNGWNVAP